MNSFLPKMFTRYIRRIPFIIFKYAMDPSNFTIILCYKDLNLFYQAVNTNIVY